MVSLQSPLSPNHRTAITDQENSTTPQKRKALEGLINSRDHTDRQVSEKRPKAEFQNFMADIELHLETPLPSEWQRCLDIKSGKIHFYNTKTDARTLTDPRKIISDNHYDEHHMSLDLELNLTTRERSSSSSSSRNNIKLNTSSVSRGLSVEAKQKSLKSTKSPPWLALEAEMQEMVATACMRCHMLVMLCRSSPACPNCKFVHPTEKSPSTFVHVKL